MDEIDSPSLNPFLWAHAEYQKDKDYWMDRAKHGTGLLKKIANFVIETGQGGNHEEVEQ